MNEPYVIRTDLPNGIASIEFFHPKHNSLPGELLDRLADMITKAGKDDRVSIIILRSGGDRTFCAGASFDELINISNVDAGKKFFSGFANVINACRKCSKLIVGRVQGKAVGGGVGIAAAVDYCLATQYAAVRLSELNIGIGPFVIGPVVERKIGLSAFSQLAINASEAKSAQWALDKGLYAEVYESAEAMDEALLKLVTSLTNTSPEARSQLKRMFWEGCENWDDLLAERATKSGQLVLSEFAKQALAQYK